MTEAFPLPVGFRTAGIHCGIKDDPALFDLALFVSETPATAAGVFTTNRVCGAPVQISRSRVPTDSGRGVIINSGNANACTGEQGRADARWMTQQVAEQLGCSAEEMLVCSTGVIGHLLPREKLEAGILRAVEQLAETPAAFHNAARAMMTTDTVPKQCVREVELEEQMVRISGAAKGAAMIAPHMATMLAVVMTDAALSPATADALLREAVNKSFNCITVEGHTSTSDSVILLANGASGTSPHNEEESAAFQKALEEVCTDLARQIIRDAEGAAHFITIDVAGLRTADEARHIAKLIAEAPLIKTAIAGADPNWGRIVSAAGYSGVELREEDISLSINGTPIYERGNPLAFDAEALSRQMRSQRDVHLELRFPLGDASARFWTSDLTTEYVRLNSEYTT